MVTGERDERARSGRAARSERRRAERARNERELADLRFVEVPESTASAFARTALDLTIAFAVGAGATWLLLLIAAIVGDEALWRLAQELDADAFLRATIVPLFAIVAALSLAIPLLGALDAATALRLLEQHASTQPLQVPSASHRARVGRVPGRYLRRAALTVAVLAMAVGGFLLFFALVDEEGRTPPVWTLIAVSCAIVIGWLAARPLLQHLEERQGERRLALEAAWQRTVGAADLAERRRREASAAVEPPRELLPTATRPGDRALAVAVVALLAALAIWFVSVWLRKPCRRCDERYFDDPVERFIDWLSLWGGVAIVGILAVIAALVVVRLVRMRRFERAAVRWVADGQPRRVRAEVVEPMLLGPRAALWWSRLIVAVFAPFALYFGLAALTDPGLRISSAAITIALAVVVVAAGAGVAAGAAELRRAAHERSLLRAVLSPGDPDPASIAARGAAQQRTRAKQARRAQRRRG